MLRVEGPVSPLSTFHSQLIISSEARDFLARLRPELVPVFQPFGGQSRIPIATLLQPASEPPLEQFVAGSINSEPGTWNPEPIFALGDLLAAFLRRLRIDALVALLQRRGWLRGCHCAARQARLNAMGPRLRMLIEPWPQTLALILAWLIFAVTLLLR